MKSLLFCLLLVAVFLFNNSYTQTTDDDAQTMASNELTTIEKTTTTGIHINESFLDNCLYDFSLVDPNLSNNR